jgi:hypothetical protein
LITRGGSSGILHPLEIRISGELLIGDGNFIGLRERFKFRTQTKIVIVYLLCNAPIIYLSGEINILLMVGLPLITSLFCSFLNLETFNQLKSRQLV